MRLTSQNVGIRCLGSDLQNVDLPLVEWQLASSTQLAHLSEYGRIVCGGSCASELVPEREYRLCGNCVIYARRIAALPPHLMPRTPHLRPAAPPSSDD